jgi:predicted short-subunit dehydrogenase-like oxidoreductase (DUF2520 family)
MNPRERDIPALAIIGAGRVGRAIHAAARAEGIDSTLAGRDDAAAACAEAEIALICVPDAAIAQVCEAVAEAVPPLRFVGHTSGATGAEPLRPATERGAAAFGLHPLQTITHEDPELIGAWCAVNGTDAEARGLAGALARRLGMQSFEVSDRSRAAYHAAASMASNFLVTLEAAAERVAGTAGVDRELLVPLVRAAVDNWAALGPERALTGPVARGDKATVAAQRDAISERAPELVELFDALVQATRELAATREVQHA